MRFLSLGDVLEIYRRIVEETGGATGIRDLNGLQSALAQPRMTFEGKDLYPSVAAKAAALGFSLVRNHPLIDGNKRVGHAAMELFLLLNGHEIEASVDEQEAVILGVASGDIDREEFLNWLEHHMIEKEMC
ncbi:MAG: type II toxin-antitoxin system death-on-curing family toxin [Chloroflexi bacterium]|nr:type II toxin-antitoxin system death-on-curing family toxin [Chloroflexota bacterium]